MNEPRRMPVISKQEELDIPWQTMRTVIAGKSLIDTFELSLGNDEDVDRFLQAYGIAEELEANKIRLLAIEYINTMLVRDTTIALPTDLTRLSIPDLLRTAALEQSTASTEWACIILKVCHAIAHSLWTKDGDAYEAALKRLRSRITPLLRTESDGLWIGDQNCSIPLIDCQFKTEKRLFRIVTKLLQKKGNLSAHIYDHIGVRFVTEDIFSAIMLIRFLRTRGVFMYANVLPQESKNSLADFSDIEMLFQNRDLAKVLSNVNADSGTMTDGTPETSNPYSDVDFKMIKFIERILVTTSTGRKAFFPCEFQILTKQTLQNPKAKSASHAEYEKRQIEGVRTRLFAGTSYIKV